MSTLDWHNHDFPELRPGPPWVMQEMIAAEPAVVEQLLREPPDGTDAAADAITSALTPRPAGHRLRLRNLRARLTGDRHPAARCGRGRPRAPHPGTTGAHHRARATHRRLPCHLPRWRNACDGACARRRARRWRTHDRDHPFSSEHDCTYRRTDTPHPAPRRLVVSHDRLHLSDRRWRCTRQPDRPPHSISRQRGQAAEDRNRGG